ncbi:MAG TPA: hypothetical protein VGE07_29750 [Herpetosiphonaceae bacterium]
MVIVLYGLVFGYIVLQARLLYRLGGGWQLAAGVPLVITVPALIASIVLLSQASNLWPLPFLFASPFALLGLGIVWVLHRAHSHGSRHTP